VTIWVFGLAGAVLAAPPGAPRTGLAARQPGRTLRLVLALAALALAIAPLRTAQSQQRLETAFDAFLRGDCATTVNQALGSLDAVSQRTEPWELLAYCDAEHGQDQLALRAIRAAVARDPGDWELHYGEALVEGVQGVDPRPAAARALALNPLGPQTKLAAKAFHTHRRRLWERRAARLPLPIFTAGAAVTSPTAHH
jgi:HAMP domain-containing protein